ncbi:MAG: CHASE domain-containing protein [Verrucomicrobiota bacterium]
MTMNQAASGGPLPAAAPPKFRWLPGVLFAVGLGLAGLLYCIASRWERLQIEDEFGRYAEVQFDLLCQQINQAQGSLQALQMLFLYSDLVERREFQGAAAGLLAQHPEVQALEWVPRVPASQRADFESRARKDGLANFHFTEPVGDGRAIPAGDRPEYYPIYYVEPVPGNEILLGWDTLAGPNREWMERARDMGELVVTPKIKIVQQPGGKQACILIMPVYSGTMTNASQSTRRAQLAGFLREVIRLEDFFDSALKDYRKMDLDLTTLDITPGTAPVVLYYRPADSQRKGSLLADAGHRSGVIEVRKNIPVGGRLWQMLFQPTPAWLAAQRSWLPEALLLIGVVCAILWGAYHRTLWRHTMEVENLVVERSTSYYLANTLLNQEVAERQRTEARLRKTQASLLQAQRISHIGSWELDLETNELTWSEETFRIFGREPGQYAPCRQNFREAVHPDDRERVQMGVAASLKQDVAYQMEHRILRPDGSERVVLEKAEVIRDGQNQHRTFLGTVEDITERRQAEAEKLQMERKLQETQKLESLGVVAGGIAHDFNNILTGVLGNANLARMSMESHAEAHGYLQSIEEASLRAADLCKQMLAYAGKGRFVITRLDLSALVEDTTHLLRLAINKTVALKFNLAKSLPPVEGDASQVRQVIMNLVINASEAIGTRDGVVTITTGLLQADRDYLNRTQFVTELAEGSYVLIRK